VLPPPLHLLLDRPPPSLFPCPNPISPLRYPRLRAPRLPGALLGRHRTVAVESPLQNPRTLSLTRTSTTRAPTFCSPGFSANFRTPASSSTAAPLFFHSDGSCSSWVATVDRPLLLPTPYQASLASARAPQPPAALQFRPEHRCRRPPSATVSCSLWTAHLSHLRTMTTPQLDSSRPREALQPLHYFPSAPHRPPDARQRLPPPPSSLSPPVVPNPKLIFPIGYTSTFPTTHWSSCAGPSPTSAAGASPSSLTPPPPLRALVEIPLPGHPLPSTRGSIRPP
jgi:hypothetical protein